MNRNKGNRSIPAAAFVNETDLNRSRPHNMVSRYAVIENRQKLIEPSIISYVATRSARMILSPKSGENDRHTNLIRFTTIIMIVGSVLNVAISYAANLFFLSGSKTALARSLKLSLITRI